jgi:hypothetical protein
VKDATLPARLRQALDDRLPSQHIYFTLCEFVHTQ